MKKTVHTGPTERPILFQTEMVKAILEGRKTQTRRQIKNVLLTENVKGAIDYSGRKNGMYQGGRCIVAKHLNYPLVGILDFCKYGKPGDLLWVRETWQESTFLAKDDPDYGYIYRASGNGMAWEQGDDTWRWKPSIHMPKSASRIWLMIEDIRVERVQEISEVDAIAEGIEPKIKTANPNYSRFKDYQNISGLSILPKPSFQSLWSSINGEESWNANPWVWVIQFRVLSTTGKPSDEQIQQNLSALASLREKREEVVND